jgi:hypothetical protein
MITLKQLNKEENSIMNFINKHRLLIPLSLLIIICGYLFLINDISIFFGNKLYELRFIYMQSPKGLLLTEIEYIFNGIHILFKIKNILFILINIVFLMISAFLIYLGIREYHVYKWSNL